MPPYKTFVLDEFVFKHAPNCTITLHSSCVEPLSLAELQSYDPSESVLDQTLAIKYGPMRGQPILRERISSLYCSPEITDSEILVTTGAIHANFLVLDTLVNAGDHVIVQHPTYLQLVELPQRAGAQVSLWKWQYDEETMSWKMNLEELRRMIQPNTKMIVLSSPNNPLGAVLTREELEEVTRIARHDNVFVMCDEVFRFLHHDDESEPTPSLLDLGYERSIVTGSLSKGFALPGIRIGWIAVSKTLGNVLDNIAHTRDYTTIAVSQIDQRIASFALLPAVQKEILSRSRIICQKNIAVLKQWAAEHKTWARISPPRGGGTVVLRVLAQDGQLVDDYAFAVALSNEEGVCVPPAGLCFGNVADGSGGTDLHGHLRIGIVFERGDLKPGLDAIARLRERWKVGSITGHTDRS